MATLRTLVAWLGGRRGVIIAGLAGWAILISAAAGSAPGESRWIGLPPLEWFVYAFVGLTVLLGVSLLVATILFRGEGKSTPPPKKSWWPAIALLLLLVVLSLRGPRDDDAEVAESPNVVDDASSSDLGGRLSALSWQEVIALLLILAAAVGVVVWTRRRVMSLPPVLVDDVPLETDLAPAVGAAFHELQLGRDPRSAVLIAYAGLEEALAVRGLARDPIETPTEHLRRALADVHIDAGPLQRLAALYEVARFSDHAITTADQRAAADSLGRVHRELGAAATGRR